jgi:hypothetical protein
LPAPLGRAWGSTNSNQGGKSAEEVSAPWRWLAMRLRLSPTQPIKEAA